MWLRSDCILDPDVTHPADVELMSGRKYQDFDANRNGISNYILWDIFIHTFPTFQIAASVA